VLHSFPTRRSSDLSDPGFYEQLGANWREYVSDIQEDDCGISVDGEFVWFSEVKKQ